MNAQEIIERIRTAEKKTPVRVFLKAREPVEFPHATVFPCGETTLVFGDWKDIGPVLEEHKGDIQELVVENDSRNSAIPLLDKRTVNARIEPGAILREQVEIGDNAVIAAGAVVTRNVPPTPSRPAFRPGSCELFNTVRRKTSQRIPIHS